MKKDTNPLNNIIAANKVMYHLRIWVQFYTRRVKKEIQIHMEEINHTFGLPGSPSSQSTRNGSTSDLAASMMTGELSIVTEEWLGVVEPTKGIIKLRKERRVNQDRHLAWVPYIRYGAAYHRLPWQAFRPTVCAIKPECTTCMSFFGR